MNEEQIRRSDDGVLRGLSGAVPWPTQDHHPSTASTASSSTTPPQLWPNVTESPPDVPSPPPPPPAGKLPTHVPPQPPPPQDAPGASSPPTSQLIKPEPPPGLSLWIQPTPAVPAVHTGDTSYDEACMPMTRFYHMAVAASADPPAIDAQLAADPPPPRALRLSSIPEDTVETSNTAASAEAEAKAVGGYKAGTVEEPPNYRWTNYPEGTKRKPHDHGRRIVTPVGAAPPHAPMPTRHVPVTVFGAHDIHPSQEVDWTRHPDEAEEQRLRDVRNLFIKAILGGV